MSDLRAELDAARDRGLISLPRFLAELSKLEIAEEQGESLSQDESLSQAAATPSGVGGGGGGSDSRNDIDSSELLVDEDGLSYEPHPERTPSPMPSLDSLHRDDEDDGDDDEEDDDESAGPQSPAASRLQASLSATHATLRDVKIVKMGTTSDFCNADRVYISYQRRKAPGRGRKGTVMETAHMWVMPDTLTVAEPAPPAPVALSPREERAAAREQREQPAEELPGRAEHERARKLPKRKAAAGPKRAARNASR